MIRIRPGCALVLALFLPPPGPAAADAGIDPALARRFFDEARTLSERDGGALWGVELYGPMLFVDPSSGSVVADRADAEGRLAPDGGVFVGPLDRDLGVANTAQEWSGTRWTTLVWPLPESRYDRRRLLAHELFHRVQDDAGIPMASPVNDHLDERDGRVWLRLEWRALTEALLRSGESKRRAIGDAVVFRARRHAVFPGSADNERRLELNEGLAEYTGLKLSGLPESTLAGRAAERLARDETSAKHQRSFAYASGPALALLLDQAVAAGAAPAWRKGVEENTDLGRLVSSAYAIVLPEDLAAAARSRAEHYDGDLLIREEDMRARSRRERRTALRRRFSEGPVLVLPATPEVSYSFDPRAIESLPGEGQVYGTVRATDAWGVLDVESGGALLKTDASSGRLVELRVPAPEDPSARPLAGDGWSLDLSRGWRVAVGKRAGDLVLVRIE